MNYDDFEPGTVLGQAKLDLEPELISEWRSLFPEGAGGADVSRISPGFVAVVAMRAYTDACSERPPGNIHGEQSYEIIRLPEIGTRLVTEVRCAAKEIRGERRWITFTTETRAADSTPLFNGVMKVAWSK